MTYSLKQDMRRTFKEHSLFSMVTDSQASLNALIKDVCMVEENFD